jgi:hypothetical protein
MENVLLGCNKGILEEQQARPTCFKGLTANSINLPNTVLNKEISWFKQLLKDTVPFTAEIDFRIKTGMVATLRENQNETA